MLVCVQRCGFAAPPRAPPPARGAARAPPTLLYCISFRLYGSFFVLVVLSPSSVVRVSS